MSRSLRGMKHCLAGSAVILALSACTTTRSHVANVDTTRGEMSYYSTADRRTSLSDRDNLASMQATEKKLQDHLRKKRGDVEATLALASVQVAKGDLDSAEKTCQAVLRRDLKNKEAKKILAQIAMRRGKYDMASIFLSSIGGAQTKDSNVLNMLAMIELQRGNNGTAMGLFKQAIKINGNDLASRMNLGVLLVKFRQLPQAAVEFERVLKAVPGHTDATIHLAIVRSSQGKHDEAERMLKSVLSVDRQNPLALYNLAVVQKASENYGDALDSLKVYMKSARGRAKDNEQVFALIEDIQKDQAAKGKRVSDEEIQAMAASVVNEPDEEVKKTASAPRSAPAAAPRQGRAQSAPAAATPAVEADDTEVLDDVEALEKALAH